MLNVSFVMPVHIRASMKSSVEFAHTNCACFVCTLEVLKSWCDAETLSGSTASSASARKPF